MAIEIYWGSGSPYSWRVLLGLALKKLPHESKLLQFSQGDHRTPEFMALSPRGKVPVLKDGDFVLTESVAILAYLDKLVPETPFFGATAQETGDVWRAVCEHENYFSPLGLAVVRPLFRGKAAEQIDAMREAVEPLHGELDRAEQKLAAHEFFVGDRVSAADIVVYPSLQTLVRAAAKPEAQALELGLFPLAQRYPKLAAWVERISALPGVEATYPPHWR